MAQVRSKRKTVAPLRAHINLTRSGRLTLSLSVALSACVWVYVQRDELFQKLEQVMAQPLSQMGFIVHRIILPTKTRTTQAEILRALKLKEGSYLFDGSLEEKQARLEALPWVKTARIQRLLYGAVRVDLIEREPIAILHDAVANKFVLLDREGMSIDRPIAACFKNLPVVSGAHASQYAPAFLERLAAYPVVRAQTASLALVHERRWNLLLRNKVKVKLPEEDLDTAFRVLTILIEQEKASSGDVIAIDLRLKGKAILKLSKTGQAYFKAFRDARKM